MFLKGWLIFTIALCQLEPLLTTTTIVISTDVLVMGLRAKG